MYTDENVFKHVSLMNRLRIVKAFFAVARDIEKTDDIFLLSDKMPDEIVMPYVKVMRQHPRVAEAFDQRRLIPEFSVEELYRLPEGTFGHEYAKFMKRHNLDPEFYPRIEVKSDADYFKRSTYQTHDMWHIITGFEANPPGELGLMAFYYRQFPLPLPILVLSAGILNILLQQAKDGADRIEMIARGWTLGKDAEPLFGVNWDDHWETPLTQLRQEFNIHVPVAKEEAKAELNNTTPIYTKAGSGAESKLKAEAYA